MALVVLLIHLVVCICLIGLVLLQRSEGGALGMGGGGGGSLMSGRGAADALARMTSVAGGFFLVTSLALTFLSGANASSTGGSVFDRTPATTAPATNPLTAPPATEPTPPDPTESTAPQAADTQLASIDPASATAPAPTDASTRAAPLATPPTTQPSRPPATQTAAGATQPAARPPQPRTPPAGGTQPASSPTQQPTRPLVLPNTSGGGTGAEDAQSGAESGEDAPLETVRRERAGPDL